MVGYGQARHPLRPQINNFLVNDNLVASGVRAIIAALAANENVIECSTVAIRLHHVREGIDQGKHGADEDGEFLWAVEEVWAYVEVAGK